MKKSLSRYSLKKDYFIIAGIVIAVITAISIGYTYSVYKSQKEIKEYNLRKASAQIDSKLKDSFDYISYLLKFLGTSILTQNPNNLENIAAILKGDLIINKEDKSKFGWEVFDWSTPDKKIKASTYVGVLKNPIDLSYRHYEQIAEKEPWILHFDTPGMGVTSGKWIIPAGMGVADKKGKLVGILGLGINVAKLTKNLENVINKEAINFIILDENYGISLYSADSNPKKIDPEYFKPLLKGYLSNIGYSPLKEAIEYNGIIYSSYLKVEGYPYTILVGYDRAIEAKEFRETLLPGIVGYTIIGIIALALLFLIRMMLVVPIMRLSSIADQLSRGSSVKKIKGGRTYEINNLALQLIKVKHFLKQEQKVKQRQKELLKIIRDSDIEKEAFLRELYNAMNTPLNLVIAGADLLKSRELGNDMDSYSEYFEMLYNAGRQLESYTTDILNISLVNIKEIINRCVIIQRKKASEIRLKIEIDVKDGIPNILADE